MTGIMRKITIANDRYPSGRSMLLKSFAILNAYLSIIGFLHETLYQGQGHHRDDRNHQQHGG